MGPTTVHVAKDIESRMITYVTHARPLLRKANTDLLLPDLHPHNLSGVENLFPQEKGTLTALCGGNSCRHLHVSVTMELGKLGRLTEETRRAAFYRRHSLAVAEQVYDTRNQTNEDVRIQTDVLAAARLAGGTSFQAVRINVI